MPVALIIDLSSGFGTAPIRNHWLFADKTAAAAAFERLKVACSAYHERANDRERIVSVEHIAGEAAIDVSTIVALGYEDALGDARADYEVWERGLAEIKAQGKLAASAITGETPEQAA